MTQITHLKEIKNAVTNKIIMLSIIFDTNNKKHLENITQILNMSAKNSFIFHTLLKTMLLVPSSILFLSVSF